MLQPLLARVLDGSSLREDEMQAAVSFIMEGSASPAQIAGLLVALRMKGETVDEITGAALAMRARMQPLSVKRKDLLDTCGTGGDHAGTFNISTAVAFVVASCGVGVAKHGNRAVSSKSGSADVLAAAGVNVEAPASVVARSIDEIGLGFLFAPSFHPAMKHAGPVRKELGVRTMFNLLGPLLNPAGARRQLLGVYDKKWQRPLAEVLARLGSERAWVVHGADGLDEITVCAGTSVVEWTGSSIREFILTPAELSLPIRTLEELRGDGPTENARIMRELLAGSGPAALRDAVAVNAAAALVIAGTAANLAEGLVLARGAMREQKPLHVLNELAQRSQAKA